MMVAQRCASAALAAAILVCATVAAEEPGRLCRVVEPDSPALQLSLSGDAVLQQVVRVHLTAGPNLLSFPFGRLEIPLDRLRLSLLAPGEDVELGDLTISPNARDTAVWELSAVQECQAELRLEYPVRGIEWRVEYSATVHPQAGTVDVAAHLALANRSRLDFPQVRLALPAGHRLTTALRRDDSFQVLLFEATGLPYRPLFIHDPSRYGGTTVAILRWLRDRQDVLSQRALLPGKVRVYAEGTPGIYLGEDTLSYHPPREPVDIRLGSVPEIQVTRRHLRATQLDVKSDVRNRLVLFDQEDEIEFEVLNKRRSPVVVSVRDRVSGDWTPVSQTATFERLDAETIEFTVELQSGELRRFSYVVRRHNLEP